MKLEKLYFDLFNDTLPRTSLQSMELSFINRVDIELFPLDFDAMWYNDSYLLDCYIVPSVYGTFIENLDKVSEHDPWFVFTNHFQGFPDFDETFFEKLTSLPEPYDGLATEYLCLIQESGNMFIDLTTEYIYEGLLDHFNFFWTIESVREFVTSWEKAKPMIDKLLAYRGVYRFEMLPELQRLIFNE
jgi:hypothetical protein